MILSIITIFIYITLYSTHAFITNDGITTSRNQMLHTTLRFMNHDDGSLHQNANKSNSSSNRRNLILSAGGGLFGGMFSFGDNNNGNIASAAYSESAANKKKSFGPTNEVVKVVNGIKHRRLGGSDIVVSELGLGTQRWVSDDFNAPSEEKCFAFMDEAILKSGVNLIDTAEQYPIPSGRGSSEGDTERVIGKWMKERNVPRENVVLATKITGGR